MKNSSRLEFEDYVDITWYVSTRALMVFFTFVALALVFKGGEYYQAYAARPVAIEKGCGYYDQTTGEFNLGAPPATVLNLPKHWSK